MNENEPFYLVNLDKCFLRHKLFTKSIPRAKIHYAVKANNDKFLIKLYSFLGSGFDCASKAEIDQVLKLGVSPAEIIFSNPVKESSSIKYAFDMGVNLMTLDNEIELIKIKENHQKARVLIRIKTNDSNAKWGLSVKFGADFKTAQHLIDLSKQLGINLVGIILI